MKSTNWRVSKRAANGRGAHCVRVHLSTTDHWHRTSELLNRVLLQSKRSVRRWGIIRRSTSGLNDGVPSLKEGGGVLVRLELDSTFLLLLVPSIPSISYS